MWSEKYRPRTLEDMVGNGEARAKFLAWLAKWKPGGKAAILLGPPGTGKTTTVHLAAKELGFQLVELNASDARTREKLTRKIGEVIGSRSLFDTRSLIFLDEVDGLAGRSDYGAVDFIKDAVHRSENPVVMAANDPDSDEVKKLARFTNKILFQRIEEETVQGRLEIIAGREGVAMEEDQLAGIVRAANGDMRSAINFLQAGRPAFKDVQLTRAQAVDAFFGANENASALRALRAYPGQPRDKIRDLYNAVVRAKLSDSRRTEALEALSRADVLMGRIMRGKDWRLLRYLDSMLACDLRKAVDGGDASFTMDAVPFMLQLRIWNDAKKLRDIGLAMGRRLGISQRGALVEDIPYVMLLARRKGFRDEFAKSLGLEENYADFVAKEAARSGRA